MKKNQSVIIDNNALENVMAQAEKSNQDHPKATKGRPKNKVSKVQAQFYLPVDIVQAISRNSFGNKSVFAQKVFEFYFESKNIKF
jgi:hypothetical protein